MFSCYIYVRFGKERFPWLPGENEYPTLNHSFRLTKEGVTEMRSLAEDFLRRHEVESRTTFRVVLLIEECGMATIAENGGRPVIAEYTLMLTDDGVRLTLRDNGKIFDITETDGRIRDISSYVLSGLLRKSEYRQHLTTISFNRSVLRVPDIGNSENTPRRRRENNRKETTVP